MIKIDIEQYLKDLEELVNIDSGSNNPEGVAKVAEILSSKFEKMGWNVKKHDFNTSVGPCLEINNKGSEEAFDVLLIGHMDTVFPKGTVAQRPFTIRENRAYGPGVNDMKAGCLLMFYVLNSLQKEGALHGSICVALNSDEEISSVYSRPWLEKLSKKSKYVLILEPARANGALVKERKGVGRFTIDITGVAAHAGVDHEKGRSAINELAYWIIELHNLTNYDLGTTLNVGMVSGGTATNVVAEKAQARVDLRFKDVKEAERVQKVIEQLINNPKTPGVSTVVAGGVVRPPMNPTEKTEELCKIVERVAQELGIEIKWASTGGGSDGNFSAALGIPTIDGLGPVGGGSHSAGEYIEINSIEERFNLLRGIIIKLVSNK